MVAIVSPIDNHKNRGHSQQPVKQRSRMAPQSTGPEAPADFTLFPNLAKELRLVIWKKALPGPRIVELIYHRRKKDSEGDVIPGHFTSRCHLPINLSVCQESRREALKQYKLSFATRNSDPKVYFDPSVDTLLLSWLVGVGEGQWFFQVMGVQDKVKHVCFTSFNLEQALRFLANSRLIDNFPSLKTLIIAADHDHQKLCKDTIVVYHSQAVENPRLLDLYQVLNNQPISADTEESEKAAGQPSIVAYHNQEWKDCLSPWHISEFQEDFTKRCPDRKVPKIKIMEIRRD